MNGKVIIALIMIAAVEVIFSLYINQCADKVWKFTLRISLAFIPLGFKPYTPTAAKTFNNIIKTRNYVNHFQISRACQIITTVFVRFLKTAVIVQNDSRRNQCSPRYERRNFITF